MNKRKNKTKNLFLALLFGALTLTSCQKQPEQTTLVMSPITYTDGVLNWERVENAQSYGVVIKANNFEMSDLVGEEHFEATTNLFEYSLNLQTPGIYTAQIVARGDGKEYLSSLPREHHFRVEEPITFLRVEELDFNVYEGVLSWNDASVEQFSPTYRVYVDGVESENKQNKKDQQYAVKFSNLIVNQTYEFGVQALGDQVSYFDSKILTISKTFLGQEDIKYNTGMSENSVLYDTELPVVHKDLPYYQHLEVITYVYTYRELPSNYITKEEKSTMQKNGESLTGFNIGGDIFFNKEGRLPAVTDESYREADVNVQSTSNRGTKRIVFNVSSWEIYYTSDHYSSFQLMVQPTKI